jgi:mannose-6-phosphate isomerase-like protein (cupin superfamily)
MPFTERPAKGLTRCLAEAGLNPDSLRIHISEIAPGTRAHPPHTHQAIEAFYVLEGRGAVEIGDPLKGQPVERHVVGPNEAILLDARTLHGLENIGDTPMRYMVIITAT